MSEWGSGYVTDTAYVHDFCRVQTPAILSFAALAKSVAAPGLDGEPLTYCDLGCGQGFTANLVAAANPASRGVCSRLQSDPHRRRACARCRCRTEQHRVSRGRFRGA